MTENYIQLRSNCCEEILSGAEVEVVVKYIFHPNIRQFTISLPLREITFIEQDNRFVIRSTWQCGHSEWSASCLFAKIRQVNSISEEISV
jgi:hypothetical protein